MKKTFLRYLILVVILNAAFFLVLIFTAWDDGNPEGADPLNRLALFVLSYVLGFPTGLLFERGFDMRLFLLIPVNVIIQYFGYQGIKKLLNQKRNSK